MQIVHFAIPLAPRKDDAQWTRVNELLTLTLGSLVNQSDSRYRIHICGQDRPEALDDPRFADVSFIRATFAPPASDAAKRRDKRGKRWLIAQHVRKEGGGYFMHMDADDLIHRDLVRHMVTDHNQVGYVIREGYAMDFANRRIAPIPGAFNKPFNSVCGSSGAVYMLPEDLPSFAYGKGDGSLLYERVRNHGFFAEGRGRGGRQLEPVPFRAGIYTLNNALNLSNILVRSEDRQMELIRGIAIRAIVDTGEIARDFGFPPELLPAEAAQQGLAEGVRPSRLAAGDEQAPAPMTKREQRIRLRQDAVEAVEIYGRQIGTLLHYLRGTNWLESARLRRPIDAKGDPIPWYTYSAISFLKPRIRHDFSVFEFGSGNSTLWWAGRAASVRAVEHEPQWAEIVQKDLPDNASLQVLPLETDGEYARAAIASGEKFDVIVVDGRDRINCARHSIPALKPDGVLIWDNTERRGYSAGFTALFDSGFRRIEFRGLAPIRGKELETSIFYRADNCLGI